MERVSHCDLCGTSLEGAAAVPGLEAAALVRCPGCGLVITSPRPAPEEIGDYYPSSYYAHVERRGGRGARWVVELKSWRGGYPVERGPLAAAGWKLLARTVGPLFLTNLPNAGAGRRLLDVGCGVGDALLWAAERGWEAHGVEIDGEAVRIAQERGLLGVRQGTLEQQAYPSGHFDAITLYQALEHVYSPRAVLTEARRILRPGGAVFVAVPNFASIPRFALGERWNALQIPLHLYHFEPATLRRLAEETGFQVAQIRYNALPVALLTNLRHLARARSAAPDGRGALTAAAGRALRALGAGGLRMNDIMLFVLRGA